MIATREKLQLLWVFLFLNFIFCDVFTLHHAPTLSKLLTGAVDGMTLTEPMLLGFAVLMELGMVMALVSRLSPLALARWGNIIVGTLLIAVQTATLLMPGPTLHYMLFSAVEIAALLCIVLTAWRWRALDATALRPAATSI